MRALIITCSVLWAYFVASKLYGVPPVSLSAKLQGTLAGRIVERQLAGYVGQRVTFSDGDVHFSATIEQIIVPDIIAYLDNGFSAAQFKAKLREVNVENPQDGELPLPDVVELRRLDSIGPGAAGHVQQLKPALLGEGFLLARLLAKYKDDNDAVFWQALVEVKRVDNSWEEIAPFVVLLSEKDDFFDFHPFVPNASSSFFQYDRAGEYAARTANTGVKD